MQPAPEPLLFESRDAAAAWGTSIYNAAWLAKLTTDQRDALTQIKGGNFAVINRYLRTNEAPPLPSASRMQRWAYDAAAGLKIKPPPSPITVFRGVSFRAMFGDVEPADLIGGIVRDRGFVSTTLLLPVALRFGDDVLVITVPEGTPGAWLDLFGRHVELEILLPAGTMLRIDGSDSESGHRILHSTVVG